MLIPGKTDDPEAIQDADTSLRLLSRLFLRSLTGLVVRPGETILCVDWGETQMALSQQKRLDRILNIDVSPTHRRVLHIEWAMRLDALATEQTASYHLQAAIAARQDARRARRRGEPEKRITVTSWVVVLTGRRAIWPKIGELRTSDETNRFTGVEFFIEPVYQRTVAQLEEMGDIFWLAFVPLACDADEPKVRRVVQCLRENANDEEFGALVATMLSMAQVKKDWRDLPHVIMSAASSTEGSMRHPWFCDGKEEGLKEGLEKGLEKGLRKGRKQGLEEGREELMRFQIELRLGRRLRAAERRNLTTLLAEEGPKKLGAAVLELSAQDLETYITSCKTQKVHVM